MLVERVVGTLRRQWRAAAICAGIGLGLATALLATSTPRYIATANILVDRGPEAIIDRLSQSSRSEADDATILSAVELLRSETIARKVVADLALGADTEFLAPNPPPIFSLLRPLVYLRDRLSPVALARQDAAIGQARAVRHLLDNLRAERIGRSHVVEIRYTATDPDRAALIANSVAQAYLDDGLEANRDASRLASAWLEGRVAELKQRAGDSDLAVQTFRAQNGLMTANGRLLGDQQLTELNSALIVARADVARARARFDRVDAILSAGRTDAIVTDVLDSSISNELRRKYLEAAKLEADISRRLGPGHAQAVRLRSDMSELKRLMFDELGRIAESYQSEVTVALSREKSLSESVAAAENQNALAGRSQVQLRELERTADTYRNLHQSFLQRLQDATQQQGFPLVQARIISKAAATSVRAFPPPALVLSLGTMLGLLAGVAIGAYREISDRVLRTGDDVRDELGLPYLGAAPLIAESQEAGPVAEHFRSLHHAGPTTAHVVDHPLSPLAETLRRAKLALDLLPVGGGARVVGVTSALPGEGKSTIAINLAELLASQGARTLLIDTDLRNPGATRLIGRHAKAGLLEALTDERPLRDLLLLDARTRLAFLPGANGHGAPQSAERLTSVTMLSLLDKARQNFDYVILDLPPLAPVIDARAIADQLDGVLAVVEWGATPIRTVRDTLYADDDILRRCFGVVLNKVDEKKMRLYRTYGSSEYFEARYAAYYKVGEDQATVRHGQSRRREPETGARP